MTQISPYPVWVGHAGEVLDFRAVFDAGIKALVQLAAEELPSQPPRELIFCRFPLLDGTGNRPEMLSLAIKTVAHLLKRHLPTLISCGAGMSRSPAVAAAGLALVHHLPPEECLERVVKHHPSDVSPALWNDIKGILDSLR
jgi:protein-tyrosine phosphatase